MKLLEKPKRLSLEDILVVTEFPPWADAALPFALSLVREHGARMHVAHAASTHFSKASRTCLPETVTGVRGAMRWRTQLSAKSWLTPMKSRQHYGQCADARISTW